MLPGAPLSVDNDRVWNSVVASIAGNSLAPVNTMMIGGLTPGTVCHCCVVAGRTIPVIPIRRLA
jgi:hypothetical protein